MIFDAKLVVEATKTRLLNLMAQFDSIGVTGRLGQVTSEIVKKLANPKEPLQPSVLDTFRQSLPDSRVIDAGFLTLLSKDSELDLTVPRWPNGTKILKFGEFDAIMLAEMAELPDLIKINTWVSTCVSWLQVYNIDDLKTRIHTEDWSGYPHPPDEEEALIRWHLESFAYMTYFY